MKHLVALLLVSIGLMMMPRAAYTQDSPTPAKPETQPSPVPVKPDAQPSLAPEPSPVAEPKPAGQTKTTGSVGPTVIGLPPVPNVEIFFNTGATDTSTVGSSSGAQNLRLPGRAFAGVATQAAQTGVDTRFAFETGFATGFLKIHNFRLVAEFPVVFNPNGDVTSGNLSLARSYSSLFFTPALRIMYAPDRDTHRGYPPVYPWISLGGGLAHFSPSAISLSGGVSGARSSTEGALQAGAGVDIGIYRKSIALRAEVRDFYTAPPDLGVTGINLRHNLFAGGGIVFRFCKTCWAGRSSDQTSRPASLAHN